MRQLLSLFLLFALNLAYSQELRVLFVGNSLTYANNLPKLVEKEAKSRGVKLRADMRAYPNYALIDHWNEQEVQKLIRYGKYEYVLVQQGPSSQEEGKKMLIEDGALLARLCEQSGARLVYFMVWPSRKHYSTFDEVIKNHQEAAQLNNALLCPVGAVWKSHLDQTQDDSYYGPDGFHPSLRGSQVAAEVIVECLLEDHKKRQSTN